MNYLQFDTRTVQWNISDLQSTCMCKTKQKTYKLRISHTQYVDHKIIIWNDPKIFLLKYSGYKYVLEHDFIHKGLQSDTFNQKLNCLQTTRVPIKTKI